MRQHQYCVYIAASGALVYLLARRRLTVRGALAVAVALNSGIDRFRTLFRVGFYTPVVTSIVAKSRAE